jgi:hypothetical protein
LSKSSSVVIARLVWHLQAVIIAAGGEHASHLRHIRRHDCPSRFGLRRSLLLRLPKHLPTDVHVSQSSFGDHRSNVQSTLHVKSKEDYKELANLPSPLK